MDILHISDLHFGPHHWAGNDRLVLERLNRFDADIVFNTGDLTSDSLPVEFEQAAAFLAKLDCPNVVSIPGNHDKYSKRSHEMFREYIYDGEFLPPKDPSKTTKDKVYFDRLKTQLKDHFNEINYMRLFNFNGEAVLVVCLDTNLFQKDPGEVELQILETMKAEISNYKHDRILMLAHHSVLSSDADPLVNSKRVTDFILDQGIEAVFCGHSHELDIVEVSDLVRGSRFCQFMCGSLTSINLSYDKNMFCTYENFGTKDEVITITRMIPSDGGLEFVETVLSR